MIETAGESVLGDPERPGDWIEADWPAPAHVRTLVTSRNGGVSAAAYAGAGGGMNLGTHVGDDPRAVAQNRARLLSILPGEPTWLHQVHGTRVLDLASLHAGAEPYADASFTRRRGEVCAVLVADCLPVFFCDWQGSVVGAAHAGWRGLAAGVLEQTISAMGAAPQDLLAWLGPCIGPRHFEVGEEVRDAFANHDPASLAMFAPCATGKWLADLPGLARLRLSAAGLRSIEGGQDCTYANPQRYYSYRRERVCGRMAALIWLEP